MQSKTASLLFLKLRAFTFFLITLCVLCGCSTPQEGNLENRTGASAVTYKPFQKGIGVNTESEKLALEAIQALETGNYKRASQSINAALRFDSQNSYLHYLNALVYHLWALHEDPSQANNAEVGYQISLQFDSGNTFSSRNLGKLYLDTHQYPKAQGQYANGLLSNPSHPIMMMGLAISSYLNQDVETALQAVKLLEKSGNYSPGMYRVAALIYAAADEPILASQYFQKLKTASTDIKMLQYIEERLKAWKEFYLIISKEDLEGGAFPQQAVEAFSSANEENVKKGANGFLARANKNPTEFGQSSNFSKRRRTKLPNSSAKKKSSKKESDPFDLSAVLDESNFSYLPYLEQGAADDDDDDSGDGSDSSDGGFGDSGGDSGDGSDSSDGGFGDSGGDSGDGSDSSDSGFGDSGGDSGDGADSSDGGFGDSGGDSGDGSDSSSFGDNSDNEQNREVFAQLKNNMVVIDVAIIRTEQIENTTYGSNFLKALGNLTNATGFPLESFSFNNNPASGTLKKTRMYSISIPQLSYSLNIANDINSYNDILATPTLVATNNKKSTFFSGTDVTLALTGVQGGGNLVTKEVGINLSVTPKFLKDGRISLNISASRTIFSNDPLPGNLATNQSLTTPAMQMLKSSVAATAALRPGESLLLSGLTEKYYLRQNDDVPGLADAPFVGYLFGNSTSQRIERSILFVLTPRFVEKLVKDANGDYIPLVSKEQKVADEKAITQLKQTYPSLFKKDPSRSFLTKLENQEYSRHFRPTDMPITEGYIIPDLSGLITEVLPYIKLN